MKKLLLVIVACLACESAYSQTSQSSDSTNKPPLGGEFYIGLGWNQLFDPALAAFLKSNSMTAIDPIRMWSTGWRFAYDLSPVQIVVTGSRTDNFLFGSYGDAQRTRLVWDETSLFVGPDLVRNDSFGWSLAAGIGVSKLAIQAYPNAPGTFAAAYAGGKIVDLVSSWNWSPEVETYLRFKLFSTKDSGSLWFKLGAQGGWLPFDSTWKLFDDAAVTGVPKPFDFFVRYSAWIGVQ